MNHVLFSSASDEWATPAETYDALNAEFNFADDACPLAGDRNGPHARVEVAMLLQPALQRHPALDGESEP